MVLLRELRTYVSAFGSIPILVMLLNATVATSLTQFVSSIGFVAAALLIAFYAGIRVLGLLAKIKSLTAQALVESLVLVAPMIYPMFTVISTGDPRDFVGVFLAYLLFGVLASLYMLVGGPKVGAFGKVSFFLFAYMLALMIYAGSLAGQLTGEKFSILLAFDQVAGVASFFFGYEGQPLILPLAGIVRLSMAFAIPAITFSALAAQVRLSEVKDNPTGRPRLVNSLRAAVALLTVGSSLLLVPALLFSRAISESAISFVTIIPPVVVAGVIVLILAITEREG